jgi:uncharacterized protein (TIGR00369 family)
VNTDRALVLRFLQGGGQPLALDNPLGTELAGTLLELDAERGSAQLAFLPEAKFLQGAQMLQGGIIAAMLDFAMAFAAYAVLDHQTFSTAALNVQLLRPAVPGRYLANGRIVRKGRRVVFAQAELAAADGQLVGSASSVLSLVDL